MNKNWDKGKQRLDTYTIMAIAEKLLTEGEAANMSSRTRTNRRSFVFSAERTCTRKKFFGMATGFVLSSFLFLMRVK